MIQQPDPIVLESLWTYMKQLNVDAVACVCIFNSCLSPLFLSVGEEVHEYVSQKFIDSPAIRYTMRSYFSQLD